MAFVVDRRHRQYAGALDHDSVVALILQGRGDRGPCLQYLENTVHHLRALGLKDVAPERLLTETQRLTGNGGRQCPSWKPAFPAPAPQSATRRVGKRGARTFKNRGSTWT